MSTAMVAVLSDNHVMRHPLSAEFGFSVLVQTSERVALLDTGSSALFARNAGKMEFELFGIDDVIVSHAHYDHTGGLGRALTEAPAALLHLHPEALLPSHSTNTGKMRYIGMPSESLDAVRRAEQEGRLRTIDTATVRLDGNLTIFSSGGRTRLPSDWPFFVEADDGNMLPQRFAGELSLLVEGDLGCLLLVGCAHTGLDAIVAKAETYTDKPIRAIVGGSHIDQASETELDDLAAFFAARETDLYLCHCTGIGGFSRLYRRLPGRLHPTGVGTVLNLEL